MRRALLTATKVAAPITIGSTTGTNQSVLGAGSNCVISARSPASGTGVCSTVSTRLVVTGSRTLAFFTCSPARIVTDITATVAAVNGLTTYSGFALAANAGDYIGIWITDADKAFVELRGTSGSGTYYWGSTVTTKPTVGTNLTVPTGGANTGNMHLSAAT